MSAAGSSSSGKKTSRFSSSVLACGTLELVSHALSITGTAHQHAIIASWLLTATSVPGDFPLHLTTGIVCSWKYFSSQEVWRIVWHPQLLLEANVVNNEQGNKTKTAEKYLGFFFHPEINKNLSAESVESNK